MCSDTSPLSGREQAHDAYPSSRGGQVGQHLGRSSSDRQDPGVAVVPLHLGPVHVAGAAVQLDRLVADVRRASHGGLLGQAGLGDDVLPGDVPAGDLAGVGARDLDLPAHLDELVPHHLVGDRAACRRSRARGSTPRSAPGSGRRCRRRAPRARSARPRTARRSGTKPVFSSPTRLAAGTRTSTNDSSAVSEQCQPILRSDRSTVKPGVPFSTTSSVTPRVARPAGADRGGHEVGADAAGDERLGAVDDVVVAVAHGRGADAGDVGAAAGLGDRERRRSSRRPASAGRTGRPGRRCREPRCAAARCRR